MLSTPCKKVKIIACSLSERYNFRQTLVAGDCLDYTFLFFSVLEEAGGK